MVLGNKLCANRMSYFEWFSENIKAVSNKNDLHLSTFLFLKATEMYKMVWHGVIKLDAFSQGNNSAYKHYCECNGLCFSNDLVHYFG